ncbi:MAG TPA: type II toxin-antitoxin system death-on-curing family toxin [Stellaceae bacterium]|nr:type II toxin-antitoxin system death-on-curing family toxin [Stellaceae bacterium]
MSKRAAGWRWLNEAALIAAHERQLAEHGGAARLRDRAALQSTLARARNKDAYGEPDAAELAAAYAFGIARNHPFVDGNKRVALLALETFLLDNGFELMVDDIETYKVIMNLAGGEIGERGFAEWVRKHLVEQ